jgi:hypothetical protein
MNPKDTLRPDRTATDLSAYRTADPPARPFQAVVAGSFLIGLMLMTAVYVILLTVLR